MIVSTQTAVLPVLRSPMISWRWPRPIGVMASMALMPVCSGSDTDCRCTTEAACSSRTRRSSASISPRPSIGAPSGLITRPRKASPTGTERTSPVRRTCWPSSMPSYAPRMTAPIVAHVEVQRDTEHATLELQQLVGHRRGEALDVRDAVTGVDDDADLFPRRPRLQGGDVALDRAADLVGGDRQLCHLVPSKVGVSWGGCGARRPRGPRRCRRSARRRRGRRGRPAGRGRAPPAGRSACRRAGSASR